MSDVWGGNFRDYPWGRCSKCGKKYIDYQKICSPCQDEAFREIKRKEKLKAEEAKKPKPPDVPAFIVDPERAIL